MTFLTGCDKADSVGLNGSPHPVKSLLRTRVTLQSCDEEHQFSGENLGA